MENIYWLTNQGNYKLLVTMEDWSGRKVFAEYASFRLEPESDYYKLRLGRYHGNAGDSFTWHNGKQFTTLDRDHDVYTGTGSLGPQFLHPMPKNKLAWQGSVEIGESDRRCPEGLRNGVLNPQAPAFLYRSSLTYVPSPQNLSNQKWSPGAREIV